MKLLLGLDAHIQQSITQLREELRKDLLELSEKCDALESSVRGIAEGIAARPYRIASNHPFTWVMRLVFQLIGMWAVIEWAVNLAIRIFDL
jgi:hypothetical protein